MAAPKRQLDGYPTDRAMAAFASPEPVSDGELISLLPETGAYRPLLVIGDSHVHAYRSQPGAMDVGYFPIGMVCPGASAKGLANAASTSGCRDRIDAFLAEASASLRDQDAAVLFKFGQVDIEFVFDFKRAASGTTEWSPDAYSRFTSAVVDRYRSFLNLMRKRHLGDLCTAVCSIFPPALSDETVRDGYVNDHLASLHGQSADLKVALRGLDHIGLADRTAAHARFNLALQEMARSEGFVFVDDFTPALDGQTIRSDLLTETGGSDHHIYPTNPALRGVVSQALRAAPLS